MAELFVYKGISHSIEVSVIPSYVDEKSSPSKQEFFWLYNINIRNASKTSITLRHRFWHITDGNGKVLQLDGEGVVGQQPMLHPSEEFEYTSGVKLATKSGIMIGCYEMETSDGSLIAVKVPAFSLDSPQQIARAN